MSEEQVTEIHNRVIKGITWRILIVSLVFSVPLIYQASVFIYNQGLQGKYIEKLNTQVDTIQQRQSRYEFNNGVKFQRINDKLDNLKDSSKWKS